MPFETPAFEGKNAENPTKSSCLSEQRAWAPVSGLGGGLACGSLCPPPPSTPSRAAERERAAALATCVREGGGGGAGSVRAGLLAERSPPTRGARGAPRGPLLRANPPHASHGARGPARSPPEWASDKHGRQLRPLRPAAWRGLGWARELPPPLAPHPSPNPHQMSGRASPGKVCSMHSTRCADLAPACVSSTPFMIQIDPSKKGNSHPSTCSGARDASNDQGAARPGHAVRPPMAVFAAHACLCCHNNW